MSEGTLVSHTTAICIKKSTNQQKCTLTTSTTTTKTSKNSKRNITLIETYEQDEDEDNANATEHVGNSSYPAMPSIDPFSNNIRTGSKINTHR